MILDDGLALSESVVRLLRSVGLDP
jgi:hypothetical protein